MKKSTILIIFIVYLASIVAIGFFGMSSKVYDEVKYVSAITVEAQVENENMRDFEDITANPTSKKKEYLLIVYFDNGIEYETGKFYVPISLTPYVVYDTGDVANSKEVSIVYYGDSKKSQKDNDGNITFKQSNKTIATLTKFGSLSCFSRDAGFDIMIKPAKEGSSEVSVTIHVAVI